MTEAETEDVAVDPLRERLLDAAATVFASKRYSGTNTGEDDAAYDEVARDRAAAAS